MACWEVDEDLTDLDRELENRTLVLMFLAPELGQGAQRVFELAQKMKLEKWQHVFLVRRRAKLKPEQQTGWFGPIAGAPPVTEVFAVRRNAQGTVLRQPVVDLMRQGAPSALRIQRALAVVPVQG